MCSPTRSSLLNEHHPTFMRMIFGCFKIKLPALGEYQLSLDPPVPPVGSYDKASADLGKILFTGKANCATCHKAPIFADNVLHTPEEMGIDDFEASRSPTGKYRTTPLRGLFARTKGGFYHDGRFVTLNDVRSEERRVGKSVALGCCMYIR